MPALAAREIEQADTRVLWSLADLDGAARRAVASGTRLAGFVSAVLTEVRLVALWRRGMLACGEWWVLPFLSSSAFFPFFFGLWC